MRAARGGTRLVDLRHSGSLKLVLPQTFRADAAAVIVNTAGGVTGGDHFEMQARVEGEGAVLTLTTQAAERAYRAQTGEVAALETSLSVGAGACLNWVPQEMILFDHSALRRRLTVDLEGDARFLMVEPVVFGRALMGETVRTTRFRDRVAIKRDGAPLYLDGVTIEGDALQHLARPATADGAGAMASLVYVAPDAPAHLDAARAHLGGAGGASLLAPDMMVMRLLAADSFALRRSLLPLLDRLSGNILPTTWRL